MRTCFDLSLTLCLLGSLAAGAAAQQPPESDLRDWLGDSQMETQLLFDDQRFPNVVVATDGSVLATWGSEQMKVRRSEDGGKSWGPEIDVARGLHGGGVTVDENSGHVWLFTHPEHPPRDGATAPRSVYRSSDHGKHWQEQPAEFHEDVRGNVPSLHMSEHGITLSHGEHAGRLIRPARVYQRPKGYNTAVYSDDGGQMWRASEPFPEEGTGEGALVELSDGRLYYNSRVHWPEAQQPTRRRSAWSSDGGETWSDWEITEVLPDGRQDRAYGCMGGLCRLPVRGRDILIFSNLDTSRSRRERLTAWASFDGGKTWPLKRLVDGGPSAYSSLAAGRPGTASEGWIFLQYEGGPEGNGGEIARFNLPWLLEGEPTGDGQIPQWLDGPRE